MRFFEAVDGGDAGVVHYREEFGLALQAVYRFGISRRGAGQHLDGDVALQPGIASFVDLPHAASAEYRNDFVWTESGARGKTHIEGVRRL